MAGTYLIFSRICKRRVFCFRYADFYFRYGESTSAASQQTSKASQLSKGRVQKKKKKGYLSLWVLTPPPPKK